jgi:hypothetical protein
VEEFQSDRHQAGRKQGYVTTENEKQSASNRIKEIRKLQNELDPNSEQYKKLESEVPELARTISTDASGRIADAPFRTTWPIQLFKRALRDAVDGGKDWIGWTTGETQNERFDLSKSLDSIEVRRIDGSNRVTVYGTKGNNNVITQQSTLEALPDVIGKELAEKVISDMSPKGTPQQIQRAKIAAEEARNKLQQPGVGYDSPLFDEYERKAEEFRVLNGKSDVSYSGLDLKVGGEGMKGFYDNMLPKEVGKYVKQFGGKVEKAEIDIREPASEAWYKEPTDNDYKPIWKVNITPEMRKISQTGQMRFLPEPVEKLSAFKGKRVQVLTSDLSLVGDVKYGDYTASFKGGPGYLDNDGWAFTDKAAADAFVTRWKKDGEPLIGLASLGSANHLNSLDARKAYAEKWKYLVSTGEISEELANDHIKQAMKRIINSDSKNVKTDWRNAAKMIKSADDLSNYFNKIPWAAAPMFYSKITAKTLPIKYKKLVELGLDLETVAKEYRQPEFEGAELGDLYAIAEYDGSTPEHKPELNKAYPWRIKFKKKATLSEMHNVAKLTTDPRAFAKKKVGGRLGAQPLMVTGINLDKLLSGDIAGSAKPLILREGTQKTKSNRAKQFGSGNPEAYRSYQQIQAERNTKKPKKRSTAKGNASAIANAAKLK